MVAIAVVIPALNLFVALVVDFGVYKADGFVRTGGMESLLSRNGRARRGVGVTDSRARQHHTSIRKARDEGVWESPSSVDLEDDAASNARAQSW